MTLFTLLNVYNEVENLPRCIESIETHFNRGPVVHIVIDGRYKDYDAPSDFSTDGTREWVLAQPNTILLSNVDYECEKRTAGLRYIDLVAEDGDFVLYQDADEEITSIFGWPQRVGKIEFTRESRPITYGRCRLYRWEPGLEFKHRHYDLYDSYGKLVSSLEDAPDFQVVGTGIHHDKAHDQDRVKTKRSYYRLLRARETHPSEQPIGA